MAGQRGRQFIIKVQISVRYILRLTEEGYEAECIDAGAVGVAATQQEALKDLVDGLEALYQADAKGMRLEPRTEDEVLYARLRAGRNEDKSIIGYGVAERVEVIPTAAGKKRNIASREGFEVSEHVKVAA